MGSFLQWIGHAPAWFAPLGSVLGAVGGLYAYVVSRRDRSRERRQALDNEWFKVLIFEQVLPPLLAFLNEQRAAFEALATDPRRRNVPADYQTALDAFKRGMSMLQRRLLVVRVISSSKYDAVIAILDEMDDVLTVHCAANSGFGIEGHEDFRSFTKVGHVLSRLTVELFSALRQLHHEMHIPQPLWKRAIRCTWQWLLGSDQT